MSDAKRSKRLVVVLALLVGLGGVGVLVLTRRMGRTSKEIEELRAELSVVQKRNSVPPLVIQQVQGGPTHQEALADPASPTSKTTTGTEHKPTREEREEELRRIAEARADLVARTFTDEAADPTWSETATRQVREKYSGPEFGALNISTECRSTLCKIEFSFSDPAAGPMAVNDLIAKHPWPSQRFTHFDQVGQQGVSYLAREGSKLPDLKLPLR